MSLQHIKNQLGIRALRVFSWHYKLMLNLMFQEFPGTRPKKGSKSANTGPKNLKNGKFYRK
jgi:hypothetical protein